MQIKFGDQSLELMPGQLLDTDMIKPLISSSFDAAFEDVGLILNLKLPLAGKNQLRVLFSWCTAVKGKGVVKLYAFFPELAYSGLMKLEVSSVEVFLPGTFEISFSNSLFMYLDASTVFDAYPDKPKFISIFWYGLKDNSRIEECFRSSVVRVNEMFLSTCQGLLNNFIQSTKSQNLTQVQSTLFRGCLSSEPVPEPIPINVIVDGWRMLIDQNGNPRLPPFAITEVLFTAKTQIETEFELVRLESELEAEKMFSRPYVEKSVKRLDKPVFLLNYLKRIQNLMDESLDQYDIWYTLMSQSSGTGKSRSAVEVLSEYSGSYCCFRGIDDTGYPKMSIPTEILYKFLKSASTSTLEEVGNSCAKFILAQMLAVAYRLDVENNLDTLKEQQYKCDPELSKDVVLFLCVMASQNELLTIESHEKARSWVGLDRNDHVAFIGKYLKRLKPDSESSGSDSETDLNRLNYRKIALSAQQSKILEDIKTSKHAEQHRKLAKAICNDVIERRPADRRLFILVIDEVTWLTQMKIDNSYDFFRIFRRALLAFRKCRLFTVFLGTTAVAREVYSRKYLESHRFERLFKFLPPIVPWVSFDVSVKTTDITLAQLDKYLNNREKFLGYLTGFGRPLWSTVKAEDAVRYALQKLRFDPNLRELSDDVRFQRWIAALGATIGLEFTPSTRLASVLVKSWMAWLLFLDQNTYLEAYCTYSSEPVLALGSCQALFGDMKDVIESKTPRYMTFLCHLKSTILDGEVEKGRIGETVCRLFLLAAFNLDCSGNPIILELSKFLKNLFAPDLSEAEARQIVWLSGMIESIGRNFKSVKVSFSHFMFANVPSSSFEITEALLSMALSRNSAIVTPPNYPGLDAIIPCLLTDHNDVLSIGYVGIQMKNFHNKRMAPVVDIFNGMKPTNDNVFNVLNIGMQVGNQEASVAAATDRNNFLNKYPMIATAAAEGQANEKLASNLNGIGIELSHVSNTTVLAVSKNAHGPTYFHGNGVSLFARSLFKDHDESIWIKDHLVFDILKSQSDYFSFMMEHSEKMRPGLHYGVSENPDTSLSDIFPVRRMVKADGSPTIKEFKDDANTSADANTCIYVDIDTDIGSDVVGSNSMEIDQ